MKQATFEGLALAAKKKQTRRETFLAQMDAVVPRAALAAVIEPHYPKAGRRGGQPKPLRDAAHLLQAAVVRAVRSGQGRRPCARSSPCAASRAWSCWMTACPTRPRS